MSITAVFLLNKAGDGFKTNLCRSGQNKKFFAENTLV